MSKPKIVSFLPYPDDYMMQFVSKKVDPSEFELHCCKAETWEEAIPHVGDATIILHGPVKPYLSREVLEAAKSLKLVQFGSIGYAQIDLDAASKLKLPVANNHAFCATTVAEYTIIAILALLRRTFMAYRACKEGDWNASQMIAQTASLHELGDKTLGILGLGSIGSRVARCAKGFGCRMLYHKRNRLSLEEEEELGVEFAEFDCLVEESDILTLHAPLNEDTKGLISREVIARMKHGSYLVNTARSGLVDEEALLEALQDGRLAGACIDVPRPPEARQGFLDRFSGLDNVIVTPHISALTIEAMERSKDQLSENVRRVLAGEAPLFIVNSDKL